MKKEPKPMCSTGATHIFKCEPQKSDKFLASKTVHSYFITLPLQTQSKMCQAKKKKKKVPQIAYPPAKYLIFQSYPTTP